MFKTETFENNKLPSEAELAQMLDISLATLRESLMMLALEGYITKRHGAGNYVHPSTLDFENRIFYDECLRRNGYSVRRKVIEQLITPADDEVAAMLGIPCSAAILRSTKIHFANKQPAILAITSIPQSLLVNPALEAIEEADFQYLHEMIWKYCRRNLAHSLNEYVPLALSENLSALFELPAGAPIIANRQVFYDTFDTPVMHSFSYFNPDFHKVRVLQNWALR